MNIDHYIPAQPPQPNNPTDIQRNMLERFALLQVGRPEDFENIRVLMSPPRDITSILGHGVMKGVRIGIIGAGLAGLSSAFELRKTGAQITVFEADENRVGGRVYTHYFDESKRLYGELGAMRIPVSHETVWHYINLFGLPTRPFVQSNPNAFIYLKDTRVRNDPEGKNVMKYIYPKYVLTEWERHTPWQQLVNYGLDSPIASAPKDERRELLQVKPYYNEYNTYWDNLSNRQIMESLSLSQGAISLISSMSSIAGQNLYSSYVDIAQANYPVNLSFLYEIPGGTSVLPNAIYRSLLNPHPNEYKGIPADQIGRVTIKKGCDVTGIHREVQNGKVILSYQSKKTKKISRDSFDYVICAIPFSTLRTIDIDPLFSSPKMQAIREVNYIASQKTLLLCSRRFWEVGGQNERIMGGGSYTDLPIINIWYPSDHSRYTGNQPPEVIKKLSQSPGVLTATYNDTLDAVRLGNLTPELRLKEVKYEVEEVHGLPRGYLDKIVTGFKTMNWNNNLWSRGALPFYNPQQKGLFSYAMMLPEYDNRVFMAGDHISPMHRWMQGALQTGMIAANQLAISFKTKQINSCTACNEI